MLVLSLQRLNRDLLRGPEPLDLSSHSLTLTEGLLLELQPLRRGLRERRFQSRRIGHKKHSLARANLRAALESVNLSGRILPIAVGLLLELQPLRRGLRDLGLRALSSRGRACPPRVILNMASVRLRC
jgi:hypothetical protein